MPTNGAVTITDEEKKAELRFLECCEDSDSGGHDVPKPMMKRLAVLGLVAHKGGGWYEGSLDNQGIHGYKADSLGDRERRPFALHQARGHQCPCLVMGPACAVLR